MLNNQLTGANNKNVVEAFIDARRAESYLHFFIDGVRTTRSNLTLKTNKRGMKGRLEEQERLGKYFFTARLNIKFYDQARYSSSLIDRHFICSV